jgi:hypothetical protein
MFYQVLISFLYICINMVKRPVPLLKPGLTIITKQMKKLTREELKNVKGGLLDPPAGCYCFTPGPPPGGPIDPDCYVGSNPELYCPVDYLLVCC